MQIDIYFKNPELDDSSMDNLITALPHSLVAMHARVNLIDHELKAPLQRSGITIGKYREADRLCIRNILQ